MSRLDSPPIGAQLDRPIVLVGLMGAGKSTVGRRLAAAIDLPFVDADAEIEKAAGMSISDIFEVCGEADFRSGERRVIRRLLSGPPHVLATGGGAFMNRETRNLIKERAISVWLRADLDLIVERATRRNTRPLLRQGDPREILAKLMDERDPIYAEADITIESIDGPHSRTVEAVAAAVETFAARLEALQ